MDRAPESSDRLAPHPAVLVVAALGIGLLAGYGIFGRSSAPSPRTSDAVYTPDAGPIRFGSLVARRLGSLDEWDPFDPFAGGFPVPPDAYAPPLVPVGPPIPALPSAPAPGAAPPPGGPGAPNLPPPSIDGSVPIGPMTIPTLPPGEIGVRPTMPGAPSLPPSAAESPRLVLVTVSGVDPAAAQKAALAAATKAGGTARAFTHMSEEGAVEAEGALLIVPSARADAALAAIKGIGAAQVDEDSSLGGSDRQSRLRGLFASRLAALRRRREELLVQFLPEAEPVKDIDSAIEKEARALAAVNLPPAAERMAAIRVLLRE